MPHIFTVESLTPDRLHVTLSWGRLVDTPPADELVRLAAGEAFTIPAAHATSIRTREGWQQGYAFTDTVVTGPVDISKPMAMSRRDFAPANSTNSIMLPVAFIGGIGFIMELMSMNGYDYEARVTAFIVGILILLVIMRAINSFARKADTKNGRHACADASQRIFWRENLAHAQSQPIRAGRAAPDQATPPEIALPQGS